MANSSVDTGSRGPALCHKLTAEAERQLRQPQDRCQAEHRATSATISPGFERPATSRPTSAAVWHTASRRSHCPRRQMISQSWCQAISWAMLARNAVESAESNFSRSATASPGPRTRRRGHLRRAWRRPARELDDRGLKNAWITEFRRGVLVVERYVPCKTRPLSTRVTGWPLDDPPPHGPSRERRRNKRRNRRLFASQIVRVESCDVRYSWSTSTRCRGVVSNGADTKPSRSPASPSQATSNDIFTRKPFRGRILESARRAVRRYWHRDLRFEAGSRSCRSCVPLRLDKL